MTKDDGRGVTDHNGNGEFREFCEFPAGPQKSSTGCEFAGEDNFKEPVPTKTEEACSSDDVEQTSLEKLGEEARELLLKGAINEEEARWLTKLKTEALKIDPATAEVKSAYVSVVDPYAFCEDLPDEWQCFGLAYFARRPGSDIWVWFGDLPDEVQKALRNRHRSELAFPVACPSPIREGKGG